MKREGVCVFVCVISWEGTSVTLFFYKHGVFSGKPQYA